MTGLDHSPEAARAVLQGLFSWARTGLGHPELIEVSVKSPHGAWRAQHWNVETLTDVETVKMLAYWCGLGREVSMGCGGMLDKPDKAWRRGGAALRGHAGALWLDVDCEA